VDQPEGTSTEPQRPGVLDRILRLFSDVRPGESATVLLLLLTIFLIMLSYYVIKTVREPLILLGGGAELKSYASAAQAGVLMVFVPLYSAFAERVNRFRLIVGVTLFFALCIQAFYAAGQAALPIGFVFFVWVGIFNVAIIAQFWSYANDLYPREAGERLFPIIAIGAAGGSWAGSKVAAMLFKSGFGTFNLMQLAAGILVVTLVFYAWVNRRESGGTGGTAKEKLARGGGFRLVLKSPYLRLLAVLLILLNLVNTTGEYILGTTVQHAAEAATAADPTVDASAFIGAFYGNYFFWVNAGTLFIQAVIVSRIVKYLGIAGVVLALPVVAFGAYGLIALGAGFTAMRWAKSAENMTDYSVMNTAKAMLWLPTSREEKYKAKQAIDTFFVRLGDVLSAGLVFVGTTMLGFRVFEFAVTNLVVVLAWSGVAWLVLRYYRSLAAAAEAEAKKEQVA